MKLWILLSIFCSVSVFNSSEGIYNFNVTAKFQSLTASVNNILNGVFSKEILTTTIIIPENSTGSSIRDFCKALLSKRLSEFRENTKLAFRLETTANLQEISGRRRRCVVLLVESFIEFLEMHKKLSPNIFRFNGFYLIVLVNGEIPEVEEIFKLMWEKQIYNVNVVLEDRDGSVLVKTFKPFHRGRCNDTKPVIVNEFKDGKFLKGLENVFAHKMENLHDCPIRVAISNNTKPHVIVEKSLKGDDKLSGRDIRLLDTLSKHYNFKIKYSFVGHEGYFNEDGTAEGPLKAVLDGKADLSISNWWLKINRSTFLGSSASYISDPVSFIIPPGRDLTPFDKLLFPFRFFLWISIVTCFLVGLFIILIIKRQTLHVRNFVFGVNVKSPALNLFIGFIGESQKTLPKTNFARFLLMMFLLYSMVIRTLYQGSFYRIVQSDKHHKKVQSIDEMIANDMTFYAPSNIVDLFQGTESIKKRFISVY